MNLVKTYIKESPIHGMGLYAAEFIPKGTKIWVLQEPFDVLYQKQWQDVLPEEQRKYLETYAYCKNGICVLCGDNGKYVNHSDNPNVINFDAYSTVAARDIQKDEELTENYMSFDDNAKQKLTTKFD